MEHNATWILRCVDYISTILAACVTAGIISLLIPSHWSAPVGMFLGMILSMAVFSIIFLVLSFLAGPFGILMPGMASAMITGMVCGMMTTANTVSLSKLFTFGAVIGLGMATGFHIYDWVLHGEVSQDKTQRRA
ncbi:MAG: hypothetical protein VYA53_05135 [Acidobacteriota bacterium]|nr:hypothetical protein [Acidobacteriota bacterium]